MHGNDGRPRLKLRESGMPEVPLLEHPLGEPTAFRPEDLVAAVRRQRGIGEERLPHLCVLEFDGDLTDKLMARGEVRRCRHWPCFHTAMWLWPKEEPRCGIVPRTIGGPYAVLVAEQAAVCGAEAVVGLTSAGCLGASMPLPAVVVADKAVRDEGTSLHYLAPSRTVAGHLPLAEALERTLANVGLAVRRGLVWTTDAPYRETRSQLDGHAAQGALAVEMQAASLFAFGRARGLATGLVAHVTNSIDQDGEPFHKGPEDADARILAEICRAAEALFPTSSAAPRPPASAKPDAAQPSQNEK